MLSRDEKSDLLFKKAPVLEFFFVDKITAGNIPNIFNGYLNRF